MKPPRIFMIPSAKTIYQEGRKPNRLKFFSRAKSKIGYNSLNNRLTDLFGEIKFDHYPLNTLEMLRNNLKNYFDLQLIAFIFYSWQLRNLPVMYLLTNPDAWLHDSIEELWFFPWVGYDDINNLESSFSTTKQLPLRIQDPGQGTPIRPRGQCARIISSWQ